MTQKTFVFGHHHPDTDSICSAIAYAALKNACGSTDVIPGRLGNISKETQFVLDYFGIPIPELIETVQPQVSDLNLLPVPSACETDSMLRAMSKIIDSPGRMSVITDKSGIFRGVIALPDIISAFTTPFQPDMLKKHHTPFENIIDALNAGIVHKIGNELDGKVAGNIYPAGLMESVELKPEDILLLSYQNLRFDMIANPPCNLIIAEAPDVNAFPEMNTATRNILCSEMAYLEVIRRLSLALPITRFIHYDNLEYFLLDENLKDVKRNMLSSSHQRFPVVDENGHVVSSISRSAFLDYNRKKVILVDHNERSQTIKGIEDAEIVEVIDHHRVADIQTASPLYLRIEPLGCTCSIIAKMYKEKQVPISKPIAGIMLSAIISDTLLFNSPTCTFTDREIAKELAEIAEIDIQSYGKEMLTAGSNLTELSPEEIITTDRKRFTFGKYKVMISQFNSGDLSGFSNQLEPVLKMMADECERHHLDLHILMLTDIIRGGTELLFSGKAKHLMMHAFGIKKDEPYQFFPGMFSRKKQVVPPLMKASAN